MKVPNQILSSGIGSLQEATGARHACHRFHRSKSWAGFGTPEELQNCLNMIPTGPSGHHGVLSSAVAQQLLCRHMSTEMQPGEAEAAQGLDFFSSQLGMSGFSSLGQAMYRIPQRWECRDGLELAGNSGPGEVVRGRLLCPHPLFLPRP